MTGGTVIVMRKFNAERALQLIEEYRIQSTFMPPILLKRTLDLPEAVRRKYDTSSLRNISVGGAPCPIPVRGPYARGRSGAREDGAVRARTGPYVRGRGRVHEDGIASMRTGPCARGRVRAREDGAVRARTGPCARGRGRAHEDTANVLGR